jgi:ABC-2 type transport system ATP-binding protein
MMIHVDQLVKTFRVFKRSEGVLGGFRDLFSRRYTELRAVDALSFDVVPGEMVGYIGPNGAGKSTTVKMLTGILTPTSGTLEVAGFHPTRQRVAYTRRIGVVFGQRTQLWWDIAVVESFKLLKRIYEVDDGDYRERMGVFNEVLDLEEYLHVPVRKLSLGQRMRCDLAAALLHRPPVLFLDEPTIGLDVVAKEKIRQFLKEVNVRFRTTVILTTHDLKDIEALCPRVLMIDHGRLIYDGSLDGVRERMGSRREVVIEFKELPRLSLLEALFPENGVRWVLLGGLRARAVFERDRIPTAAMIEQVIRRFPIHDLTVEDPPIEEIVRQIYQQGSLRDG